MGEPLPGAVRAYIGWYEDDHLYAGAMNGPWLYAGRRIVSTAAMRRDWLQDRPHLDPLPLGGCHVSIYSIAEDHVDDRRMWSMTTMYDELEPAGRGFTDRRHLYTGFHESVFARLFDEAPMRSRHALDHPYAGVIVGLIDLLPTNDLDELASWAHD